MAPVLLNSIPRGFSILTKNFSHVASSRRARSLVSSNGRITLHFTCKPRRSHHVVSLHGALTELRPGLKKSVGRRNELNELVGRGDVRGICFCKDDKSPEDIGMEKGMKILDWPILERWDVPWDWKATLFTIMASGLSFLLTGLVETAAVSYLGIRQGHLMSFDGQATLLFIDQFLVTAVGLTVIYAFVNRYQPLPNDLFRFEWKEPLNLQNGWLLWGGIGIVIAALGERYSKRTVKVTKQHNEDCKKLLRLMGVPVIEAPSEAEAECASLCKSGKVYAVASEDMDSLTFGATRFLRHLMEPSSKKIPVMEFEISKVLEELNLTMDQFIDMCILCGCDYCDTIRGIGAQTALKLVRQHGCLEKILENLNKDRYQIPEDWPYERARSLFKEPLVTPPESQPDLKWIAPDEEGLKNFLVNENGFNHERVTKAIEKIKVAKNKASQGRLESFFKPTINTTVPAKRKETTTAKPGKESANKKSKAGKK